MIALAGAAIWAIHRLQRIVLVLILAMFFAYVIAPLVDLVQHRVRRGGHSRRVPRAIAIAIVYVILASGAAGEAAIIWPRAALQLNDAIANGPRYTESFRVWEHGWTRYYERLRIPLEVRHSIDASVIGAGDTAFAASMESSSRFHRAPCSCEHVPL